MSRASGGRGTDVHLFGRFRLDGDPGIGKTTLIDAFLAQIAAPVIEALPQDNGVSIG